MKERTWWRYSLDYNVLISIVIVVEMFSHCIHWECVLIVCACSSLLYLVLYCPVYFMLSVGVILCDCVTCTFLSYCSTVALCNCHRVETHSQLKPILMQCRENFLLHQGKWQYTHSNLAPTLISVSKRNFNIQNTVHLFEPKLQIPTPVTRKSRNCTFKLLTWIIMMMTMTTKTGTEFFVFITSLTVLQMTM
jgi:hypothetical protein